MSSATREHDGRAVGRACSLAVLNGQQALGLGESLAVEGITVEVVSAGPEATR